MNDAIAPTLAALGELTGGLWRHLPALLESPAEAASLLRAWYAEHGAAVERLVADDRRVPSDDGVFQRDVLWRDGPFTLALHAWPPTAAMGPDRYEDLHNHVASTVGLTLRGAVCHHLAVPSVDELLAAWLGRSTCERTGETSVTFAAGEAYSLRSHEFHRVENRGAGWSHTLFATGRPASSINLHVSRRSGAVYLKTRRGLLEELERLRARWAGADDDRAALLAAARMHAADLGWHAVPDPLEKA